MTIRTIRKKVLAMLLEAERKYKLHRDEMQRSCTASCEEQIQWYTTSFILQDVLRLLGARVPPRFRGVN